MIAVFARPNHPDYGNSEWSHHGYVVIFVRCETVEEMIAVKAHLVYEGMPEPFTAHENYEKGWYGGKMEHIATVVGPTALAVLGPLGHPNKRNSLGDNRYCGVYTAAEILGHDG